MRDTNQIKTAILEEGAVKGNSEYTAMKSLQNIGIEVVKEFEVGKKIVYNCKDAEGDFAIVATLNKYHELENPQIHANVWWS